MHRVYYIEPQIGLLRHLIMPLGHQMCETNEREPSVPFYSLEHQQRTLGT